MCIDGSEAKLLLKLLGVWCEVGNFVWPSTNSLQDKRDEHFRAFFVGRIHIRKFFH